MFHLNPSCAVTNIALGIYLFFDSTFSTAFGLFLLVAIVGVVMYKVLHLLYNILPSLIKCYNRKEGRYTKKINMLADM